MRRGSVYFGGYRVTTTQREIEPAITLSAGPVGVYPRVLRAMSRPVQYDFDPYFQEFYEIVNQKVSKALRIDYPALIQLESFVPGTFIKGHGIYLVDPLGNIMMYYGFDFAGKELLKDLKKLLKNSNIG